MKDTFNMPELDRDSGEALYLQLYGKLKKVILDGVLLPDAKLPSVRRMAEQLGVNQVTVVTAFRKLESEGFVYSKAGSGTFVSACLPPAADGDTRASSFIQDEVYRLEDQGIFSEGIVSIGENTVNFASATPSPELFPVDNFKIVLNEVLERDRGNAFDYQESQGYFPLRESVTHLLQKSGLFCNIDDIHIISGAQQGIDIISKALIHKGNYIITESPTYRGATAVFRSREANVAEVQMEPDGPDLNLLEYNIKKYRPGFFYTIPSFQNPTGYSYSNDKRRQLLELAEKYNFHIIEDDYVSDLDFESRGYLPLKALDRHGRVILVKSFSKIFMPGLRLGFMVVPAEVSGRVLAAKHTTDISTSGLIQRAFDLYLRKGFWDSHFKFMYETYRERYETVIAALDTHVPGRYTFNKPGGGLNLWLGLPYGFPVSSLVRQAAANDLVFAPGRLFYSNSAPQSLNNIRLSFASVASGKIEAGIDLLFSLVRRLESGSSPSGNLPIL